jgi:dipeptidyl aminopeptidase/acylaminoacyl peptidase
VLSGSPGELAEALWLSNRTIAYVNGSALWHVGIAEGDSGKALHMLDFPEGTEPSGLQYEPESGNLVFSAAVWTADGNLSKTAEHDAAWEDRGNSGTVFDDLLVRHWDTWRIPGRVYTLASTRIQRKRRARDVEEMIADRTFTNVLKGTGLYSQMDAISEFSVSPTHLAVALKPPYLNVAVHTRMEVYYIALGYGEAPQEPTILTGGGQGAVSGVEFSPDGRKVAWLEMAQDGYESDKRVVVVHTLSSWGTGKGTSVRWTDAWDRSPSTLVWDGDSDSLYLLAEYKGRVLPYHLSTPGRLPTPLHFRGSTSSIAVLNATTSTLLLTINSLTSPNEVFVLDLHDAPAGSDHSGDPDKHPPEAIHQISNFSTSHIDGRLDNLSGEELWFHGVDNRMVMAWTIKPRGWAKDDAAGTWPMAFFIHGGPQGAWEDAWSTRWNPAMFASMGYFVVAVNPTGSTGYGQEFTDRIQEHWGDRPYQDLLAGYHAALDKFPEVS